MKDFWLDEGKVRLVIIAFSVIGLVALGYISLMSGSERVAISDLPSHSGEVVQVEGTVVGAIHHRSGLTEALIEDEGDLLYLDVERSTKELSPGDHITVRGEAFVWDGSTRMSVSTDRTMSVDRSEGPSNFSVSPPGSICSLKGIIISTDRYGWNGYNLSVETLDPYGGRAVAWLQVQRDESPPAVGDGVQATGLRTGQDGMVCFGPDSILVMFRSTPMNTTLEELIGSEPGAVPRDPMTFDCYLKYTPSGRSLYICEAPEGSRLAIKVVPQEPITTLRKGDRVRLVNCSMEWDPSSMRYNVIPSDVLLIEMHPTWNLALGKLPYGIGDYEGCPVLLTGELRQDIDGLRLVDGNSTLEVRGGSILDPAQGMIVFDEGASSYYLDRESSV